MGDCRLVDAYESFSSKLRRQFPAHASAAALCEMIPKYNVRGDPIVMVRALQNRKYKHVVDDGW